MFKPKIFENLFLKKKASQSIDYEAFDFVGVEGFEPPTLCL